MNGSARSHVRVLDSAAHVDRPRSIGHDHTELRYRPEIDGLRAVAVLAVIGFHAFPDYFPGGFLGVDVFFVISGFLITGIILRQLSAGKFSLLDFYARRARRLLPALSVVLLACISFGWYMLLPDEFEYLGKHVAAAGAFASNFALWAEAGYFDPESEFKPLLHLWSLGVEEQYYLMWPVLLILLWRAGRSIAITVAILVVASLVFNMALVQEQSIGAFYFPLSRFWELGFGGLLAVARAKESIPGHLRTRWASPNPDPGTLRRFVSEALPIIGALLICGGIAWYDADAEFPGWAALLPTVGAILLLSAEPESWFNRRVLALRALVFIGLISYPLYLWHWPIIAFANILYEGTPGGVIRGGAVLTSLLLAWGTYEFIERPIRKRRAVAVPISLVGATAAIATAGIAIYALSGLPQRFDIDLTETQQASRRNELCVARFGDERNFNYCKSTSAASPAVMFMGDSQALALYEGTVWGLGSTPDLMLLGRGGCPPLLNVDIYDAQEGPRGCERLWKRFVEYAGSVSPQLIVVTGRSAYYFEGDTIEMSRGGTPVSRKKQAFKEGLQQALLALSSIAPVIYVHEVPYFDSTPTCFLRPFKQPGSKCSPVMPRSTMEQRMSAYRAMLDDVKAAVPGVRFIDSLEAFCNEETCSQIDEDTILYSDKSHLSPAGARSLVERSGLLGQVERAVGPDGRSAALRSIAPIE